MSWRETLSNVSARLREIRLLDTSTLSRPKRVGIKLMRWVKHLAQELSQDRCQEKAASLAFTTLLTLIPVGALLVSYFKWIGTLETFSFSLQAWASKVLVADAAQDATAYVDQIVSEVSPSKLGIYGLLGLLVSAYIWVSAIERAVNDIWKVDASRSLLRRARMVFVSVFIAPLFMLLSMYIWGRAQEFKFLGFHPDQAWFKGLLQFVGPYVLTLPPFFLLIKFIPNTHVRWRTAFVATLITSILFELSKHGFGIYVTHVVQVNKLYGSLGLIPIFLIWLFLSWLIFLIGVAIAYTSQNLKALHLEDLEKWTD